MAAPSVAACLQVAPCFQLSPWTHEGLAAVVTACHTRCWALHLLSLLSSPSGLPGNMGPGRQSHRRDSECAAQLWGPAAFRQLWGIFIFPAKMGS